MARFRAEANLTEEGQGEGDRCELPSGRRPAHLEGACDRCRAVFLGLKEKHYLLLPRPLVTAKLPFYLGGFPASFTRVSIPAHDFTTLLSSPS